ncbi:hypothetical protein [Alterinioella nitratireducens]|uniref:hypothetical protein n=1 Tax=Alterinioella nitratireducens TaxID=2735915 RepID=UPI0040581E16
MTERPRMNVEDWANAAGLLAVGFLLGLATNAALPLFGTDFWYVVILIPVLFGGVILLAWLTDGLIDRVFVALSGKGIEPARIPKVTTRKPLARLLSLPLPDETERIPSTAGPAAPNAAFRIQARPC